MEYDESFSLAASEYEIFYQHNMQKAIQWKGLSPVLHKAIK